MLEERKKRMMKDSRYVRILNDTKFDLEAEFT